MTTMAQAQDTDALFDACETVLADWEGRGYRSRRFSRNGAHAPCPRCEGEGEEPGAPEEPDGTCRCLLCAGRGRVPLGVARASAMIDELEGA